MQIAESALGAIGGETGRLMRTSKDPMNLQLEIIANCWLYMFLGIGIAQLLIMWYSCEDDGALIEPVSDSYAGGYSCLDSTWALCS